MKTPISAAVPVTTDRRKALLALGGLALVPAAFGLRPALGQSTPDDYVPLMLEAGTFTKMLAELALAKAEAPLVTRFAELEIGEVKAIEAVLMPLASGPAPTPDGTEAETLATLRDMPAGGAFDRAFVDAQIRGHREALAIQQPLSAMDEITVPVATAKLAEESIKSHIEMLELIRASVG